MPDQLQLRGGTTTEHNSFTGAAREVTVDTTKKTLVVHDGSQAGGTPLMKESGTVDPTSISIGTGGVQRLAISNSGVVFNETGVDVDFRIEGDTDPFLFNADAGNDRIGINAQLPQARLHVSNENHLSALTLSSGTQIVASGTGNQSSFIGISILGGNSTGASLLNLGDIDDEDAGQIGYFHSDNSLRINVAASERMRIDSAGRLLLGTTTEGHSSADDLTVNNSGNCGITIRSGSSNDGSIFFSDATSGNGETRGVIKYKHADDALTFNTNGNERMRINSSGFLGIGATNIDSPLEVAGVGPSLVTIHKNDGSTNDEARLMLGALSSFQPDQRGAGIAAINNGAGHDLVIKCSTTHGLGPSEKIRITSAGNFGINTSSPQFTLDVKGVQRIGDGNAGHRIVFSRSGLGDELIIGVDGTGVGDVNDAVIQSSPSFGRPLIFGTNNAERMRIDSSGRVLVGMTSGSGAQLQVDDGIQVYSTATNGNSNCGTMDFTGGNFRLMAHNSSAGATLSFLMNESSGVGVSEKGRFNPNGHFLVGTTSDTTGGTAATEGVAIRKEGHVVSRGTSSSGAKFTAKTTDTGGSLAFRVMLAQTEIGSISMGAGGTAFNTTSDYRRKENVVDLTDAITRLKTLLPKRFNFIGDSGVTRDGFLAHEVTAVPEAIYGAKDAVEPEDNENSGVKKGDPIYQQIDQSKLVPLLVAAVKELIGKVEALEAA